MKRKYSHDTAIRPVTADHILFDEALVTFRPADLEIPPPKCDDRGGTSFLLLDCCLDEPIPTSNATVGATSKVMLGNAPYDAFVSEIQLPPWCEQHNGHLAATAFAAILSFAAGRPVKATRNDYYRSPLPETHLMPIAIQFPVLTAGPGAADYRLSAKSDAALRTDFGRVLHVLYQCNYTDYETLLRSIRTVQLSHLNFREDFGLAYFLLIAAIEAIAHEAIHKNDVADQPEPDESDWTEKAKTDSNFKSLYDAYKKKDRYLKRRFVRFIQKYCPAKDWEALPHPMENMLAALDPDGSEKHGWITEKSWHEVYPSDLTPDEISQLLKDAYEHRSWFVHRGESPPHHDPNTCNRFFEKQWIFEADGVSECVLPSYRLLAFLAKESILRWGESLVAGG